MGSMVNLDTMVIWAPPAATDSERASQASQQRRFIFHREPSSQPSSTTASHISDEPIYISSDNESTFETDEPASCSGSEDMEDSKSDDTLPSINTILTSVKKSSPDLCPIRSPCNDTNQPLSLDTGASRYDQEAATGPDTVLPSTPTTAQASTAMQSHISGSPDCMELVASGDAWIRSTMREL
ncbi:unnamed protein product [Clonostachys rosea f. rosea IK726]|uniref:Uncharacterized protein n=1 Tax=Clonostachys rosea f. rosea IK726 TaxID=1349383 RepID=A0ACA9UDL8_BIOOC|nr:unnamed protein product [Clonostachys rosea f. rosea IK726]